MEPRFGLDQPTLGTVSGSERRKLQRWRRFWRVVAVLLAAIAAMWLVALLKPGNAGGVVALELITAVPLALVVWRLRRVGRKLDAIVRRDAANDPAALEAPASPTPVAPDVRFDASRRPDIVLRTK